MKASFLAGATSSTHVLLNAVISAGKPKGLLSVPDVSVENGVLTISRFEAIFPSGVYVDTERAADIAAPQVTTSGAVFTLVLRINPGLFTQPELTLLTGAIVPNQLEDYVVLGWISYPGGSLAYTTDMFVAAPKAAAAKVLGDFDAYTLQSRVVADAELSAAVDRFGCLVLTSTAVARKEYKVRLLVPVQDESPQSLLVDMALTAQASLSWTRVDEDDGVAIETAVAGAGLSGSLSRSRLLLPFARSRFVPWQVQALEMNLSLGSGAGARIYRVAVTTLPASSATAL